MLIGVALPVRKKQVIVVRLHTLPAIADRSGEALADFDCASLVVLSVNRQRRSGQVSVAASVCLVVTHHAANEEVKQERALDVGTGVEHRQLVVGVCDYLLLVIPGLFVLLKELRDAELLQKDPHILPCLQACARGSHACASARAAS